MSPDPAKMLRQYFEQMSVAKPFVVRVGSDWETHRRELQAFVLDCAGLKPLPKARGFDPANLKVSRGPQGPKLIPKRGMFPGKSGQR